MGASTAGYCVGNLLVEGYEAPWEDSSEPYPESLAPPLQVAPALSIVLLHAMFHVRHSVNKAEEPWDYILQSPE